MISHVVKFCFFVIFLSSSALCKELNLVSLSYFNSQKFSEGAIDVYTKLNDGEVVESLDKQLIIGAERVLIFRARFLSTQDLDLNPSLIKDLSNLNQLNRKTQYTEKSPGVYQGHRPSTFFDINFSMKMTVELKKSKDGFETLSVKQELYDYNRFLVKTLNEFEVKKIAEKKFVIDIKGGVGLKSSVPDFIQRKMQREYAEKIQHFSKAISKIFQSKK